MSLTRESSTRESYLTLHVTYHQEMAIKNLYTSKGWLFKKKVLKVMFVDTGTEETGNDVVGGRDINISIDNTTDRDQDTAEQETNVRITNATVSSPDKVDNARVVIEKLKIETGTENEERTEKDNDETVDYDEDTDDSNDDWVANLNVNDEDDDDDEEYSPVKETRTKGRGAKRRSSGLKLSIRKGNSEKKAKRSLQHVQSETVAKATAEKHVPSTSTAETDRDDSVGEGRSIVKTEDHSEDNEVPVDVSNIDLGLGGDTDRSALEIELQETDDIDHYETVHKTLSPDEPFSPPSDVRGSDGFSPSLGCYYCHDCGYTFQIQRWYNIHKWDGRCVYTCQVCSMKFTFRNITAYREHLKTHKYKLQVRLKQSVGDSRPKHLDKKESRKIYYQMKRERLMQDQEAYDAFKKKDIIRAKKYRERISQCEEKRKRSNEKAKLRMRRLRERHPEKPNKSKTCNMQEKQKEYWRRKKQEQRAKLTSEQKEKEKEIRREKYHSQKKQQLNFEKLK